MRDYLKFYIGGKWVEPTQPKTLEVINPATETVCGHISLGSAADVDRAVKAAREAFETFSQTSREKRIELLERIVAEFKKRHENMAKAITEEMGAPVWLAQRAQAAMGPAHFMTAIQVLKTYKFEERRGTTVIAKEPIGVCGFITPWNWPVNQIACKVAPALATGCTIVIKPSEIAPFSGLIFAEILDAAGVSPGVFNLVNGDGPTVGAAMRRDLFVYRRDRIVERVNLAACARQAPLSAHAATGGPAFRPQPCRGRHRSSPWRVHGSACARLCRARPRSGPLRPRSLPDHSRVGAILHWRGNGRRGGAC
ncbi:aldehyde dehydrogenase family protein [Methylocystis hirsuta]|uniref:Aldehyde dehydrogenase family protein n=1 Tax=Methylocystis hirsuta TaxID=369798 RepID=A0A3M9XM93_9HYPH|nr:aldehyde dehydrogenase family protein [Methylocystis hirsuta]RNJ47990.1 aldehyde dehydrogenase family protein [Methylocystis hirsuta]